MAQERKQSLSSPASDAFIAAIKEGDFSLVKKNCLSLITVFTSNNEDDAVFESTEYALYLGLRWAIAYWNQQTSHRWQIALFVLGACIQYVPFNLGEYIKLKQSNNESISWLAHDFLPSKDISSELNPLNNLWVHLFVRGYQAYVVELPFDLSFIAEFLASIGWARDLILPEDSDQALKNLKSHVQLACAPLVSKDISHVLPTTVLLQLVTALKTGKANYKAESDKDCKRYQSVSIALREFLSPPGISHIVADYASSGLFRLVKKPLVETEKMLEIENSVVTRNV